MAAPSAELKAILEALIFASPEPLTPKAMYKLLDAETKEDVQAALAELKEDYKRPGGLQLAKWPADIRSSRRSDLHEWVRQLFHERTTQRLTVQALETLAVIAYRQPITALEITEVRGVNTSGVLNTLLERHLIKIVGRKQVVGRPFLYATTKEFLIRFGLNELTDLPKVEDMAEALGLDAPLLVEQAPPEDLLPLDEPNPGRKTPAARSIETAADVARPFQGREGAVHLPVDRCDRASRHRLPQTRSSARQKRAAGNIDYCSGSRRLSRRHRVVAGDAFWCESVRAELLPFAGADASKRDLVGPPDRRRKVDLPYDRATYDLAACHAMYGLLGSGSPLPAAIARASARSSAGYPESARSTTRRSSVTGWPIASHIFRTCRLRPSRTVTRRWLWPERDDLGRFRAPAVDRHAFRQAG